MNEIEEKARRMGWAPEDEWKGDPENWKDAEAFVEWAGDRIGPLKENLERMDGKFADLQGRFSELQGTLKEFKEFSSKAEERAYNRAKKEHEADLKRLRAQYKKAAKDQDLDALDAIEAEMDGLEAPEKPAPAKTETKQPSNAADSPEFIEWRSIHKDWYDEDAEMTIYADNTAAPFVRKKNPNLTGKAFLDLVAEEVKKKFPKQFENPNRNKAGAVAGGDREEHGKPGKRSFDNLPPEDKAQFEKFKKQFKGMGIDYTKEEFLAEYDWGDE